MAPVTARGRSTVARRPLPGSEAHQRPATRAKKCVNPCARFAPVCQQIFPAQAVWVPRTARPAPPADPGPPVAVEYRGEPVHYSNVHTWSEHVVAAAEHVVGIAQDTPTDVSCIVGCAVLTGTGAVM